MIYITRLCPQGGSYFALVSPAEQPRCRCNPQVTCLRTTTHPARRTSPISSRFYPIRKPNLASRAFWGGEASKLSTACARHIGTVILTAMFFTPGWRRDPTASPTAQPVAMFTESPGDTPQTPEAAEPVETHQPTRGGRRRLPRGRSPPPRGASRRVSTVAPPTMAPTPWPTERPERTSTPGQGSPSTPTPNDDDHLTPEPTEPPEGKDRDRR